MKWSHDPDKITTPLQIFARLIIAYNPLNKMISYISDNGQISARESTPQTAMVPAVVATDRLITRAALGINGRNPSGEYGGFITRIVLRNRHEDAKQAPEMDVAKPRRSASQINRKNASAAVTGVEGRKTRL